MIRAFPYSRLLVKGEHDKVSAIDLINICPAEWRVSRYGLGFPSDAISSRAGKRGLSMASGTKTGGIDDCWSLMFLSPVDEGEDSIGFPRFLPRLLLIALALAMDGLLYRTTEICGLNCKKSVTYLDKEFCRKWASPVANLIFICLAAFEYEKKSFVDVDLCS